VQDADEDGALDREVEAAVAHQIGQDLGNPQPLPQPPEQQRPADPHTGKAPGLHLGKDHRPLAVARERGDQPVQFAAGQQCVLAPESTDDLLADPAALAHALDQVQIGVAPGRLLADEHADVVRHYPAKSNIK
jgi:hypothetical protein